MHRLLWSCVIVINYNHFTFFPDISMCHSITYMSQKVMSHVIDFNTIHFMLLSIKPKEVAILIFPASFSFYFVVTAKLYQRFVFPIIFTIFMIYFICKCKQKIKSLDFFVFRQL